VLTEVLADPSALERMRAASVRRFEDGLTWPQILGAYETLLLHHLPQEARNGVVADRKA
jgi:hypothetical protein